MIGRKNGRMITRLLAWMLTLAMLYTSMPMDGMRVYAEETVSDSSVFIDENNIADIELEDNSEKELTNECAEENDEEKELFNLLGTTEENISEENIFENVEISPAVEAVQYGSDTVFTYIINDDIFTYTINDDNRSVTITGYKGRFVDLIIPKMIDGYLVTAIGESAFEWGGFNFTGTLVIPDSVIAIGNNAFNGCNFTGDLVIPDSVVTIGNNAFNGCYGFTGSLKIGNSVTTIGDSAFADCFGFTGDLIIPDSVNVIGTDAFHMPERYSVDRGDGWVTLVDSNTRVGFTGDLTIGNSVNTIGSGAFFGCRSFKGKLTIGESVTTIGRSAFFGCKGFTGALIIPDAVESLGTSAFNFCSGFTSLILPKSISFIGSSTFSNCSGLTGSLVIPDSVKEIGDGAFENCSGFTGNLILGKKITRIGISAFYNCSGFTGALIIPNSVTTMEGSTFARCTGLTSVIIPSTVTDMSVYVFDHCDGLQRIQNNSDCLIYIKDIGNGEWFDSVTHQMINVYLKKGTAINDNNGHIPSVSECEVSFHANGGTGKTIAKIRLVNDNFVQLPVCTFSRVGYSFAGWNTKKDGTGNWYSGGSYVSSGNFSVRSVILYAQWTPNRYSVSYNTNGGTNSEQNPSYIEYGSKPFTLKAATKPGYTFAGWYKEPALKTKVSTLEGSKKMAYTLYAKWTLATYTISYVLPKDAANDKTNPKNYKMADSAKSLKPATMKGYDFSGWYLDAELTNRVDSITTGMYGNLKLYPKWKPHTYTIRYNSNGGTGGSTSNTTHKYKTSGTVAACGFTKTGYNVAKWETKSNGKVKTYAAGYDKNDLTTTDGEIIDFYAQWVANKYTVTYNGYGATSGKTSDTTMTFDKSGTLAKNGFKKTGYTFVEWNTKADGTGKSYGAGKKATYNLTSVNNGTVILYAIWKPIQYKIVFKMPDNSFQISNIAVAKYDEDVVLPSCDSTYKGCYFVGWSLKTDGSTGVYGTKQCIRNLTTGSSVTLYPIWNYDINFDANGGVGTMSTQQMPYNKSTALAKSTFTRTGYEFAGWETTLNGKVKKLKDNEKVNNLFNSNGAKVVLKAVWKANTYEIWFTAENDKGTSSIKKVKATYDKDFTIPVNIFTRKDYDLVGWNTQSDGRGKNYLPGETVKNLTVDSICMPLYACWTKKVGVEEIRADKSINISLNNGPVDLNGKVVILPENATNKKLKWTIVSQNPAGCATIDATTGVLTPKKEGTVKVKATATDGSGKIVIINVNVSNEKYKNIFLAVPYFAQKEIDGCGISSISMIEAFFGEKSVDEYEDIYNRVKLANGNSLSLSAKMYTCYQSVDISLEAFYSELSIGNPILIRREPNNHWSVIVGYNGNVNKLEISGFIVWDTKRGVSSCTAEQLYADKDGKKFSLERWLNAPSWDETAGIYVDKGKCNLTQARVRRKGIESIIE